MSEHEATLELTADQRELARRYSLSAEDVKRVRGDTWDERCRDAERLAALTEPKSIRERTQRKLQAMEDSPNTGELAALAIKSAEHRRIVEMLHPSTEDDYPRSREGRQAGRGCPLAARIVTRRIAAAAAPPLEDIEFFLTFGPFDQVIRLAERGLLFEEIAALAERRTWRHIDTGKEHTAAKAVELYER